MKEGKEMERILKALANRRRLAIIKYLKVNSKASVTDLAEAISLSFRSTSKHLGILGVADILEKEQRSRIMFYELAKGQTEVAKRIACGDAGLDVRRTQLPNQRADVGLLLRRRVREPDACDDRQHERTAKPFQPHDELLPTCAKQYPTVSAPCTRK